jgi:DNA-binding MarR family transcriptional regulator
MSRLDAEQIGRARLWRNLGISWGEIGRRFGCKPDTVQRALDEVFRAKEQKRSKNRPSRKKRDGVRERRDGYRPTEEEYRAAAALIPKEDRDLTGRMFGDPMFCRSALYRKLTT